MLALVEEFRKGFLVVPLFVRMAGHFGAGALLSQIVYWYLPDKSGGETKLRHVGDDGYLWIAKQHRQWEPETGMDEDEVMGYLARLVKSELVYKRVGTFGGERSTFVRLNEEKFAALFWQEVNSPSSRNAVKESKPEPVKLELGPRDDNVMSMWAKAKLHMEWAGGNDPHYQTWIKQTVGWRLIDKAVLVLTTSPHAPAWFDKMMGSRILPAVKDVFGDDFTVRLEVVDAIPDRRK